MPAPIRLSRDVERAILTDYMARDDRGKSCYSIHEVAAKHGVTHHVVDKVRRKWRVGRYMTNGRAA